MFEIEFFTTQRGDSPIDKFLDELEENGRLKVLAFIERLKQDGPNLKRPFADIVSGKIRELRIPYKKNEYRILYFFFLKNRIILVHAFSKKTGRLRANDLELAIHRMKEWESRHQEKIER